MTPAAAIGKYLPPHLADRLRGIGLTVRRPVEGRRQGLHRSAHLGASVEFAEYREYTQGDPPNTIDWDVYARSDRYVVRRFKEETNLRAWILLDESESLDFRELGPQPKMEFAARLAAGLLFILVHQGDSAGLMSFAARVRRTIPPVGSLDGLREPLLFLDELRPAGRGDIEASLHEAAGMLRARSLVVVISDLMERPDRVLRGIAHLRHDGHEVLVLHVLYGAELRLPYSGPMELRELETGARLMLDIEEVRAAFEREAERYVEELRAGCADCAARYHTLDTRTPVDPLLFTRIATL